MGRKLQNNIELCPECGHLLSQKTWSCHFCGWPIGDVESFNSDMDSIVYYSNIDNIADVDRDIECLIDRA
jgi:hypothetical protein